MLQQQVAEYEVDRLRRKRQRARIGADAIEAAPEALAALRLLCHRNIDIDSDDARARKPAAQRGRAGTGAATKVDDDARLELEVLQPLKQLGARDRCGL